MTQPIKVGVSACLLGEKVRYDGGHKHDRNITDTLGAYFTLVPVCPEAGCGLPTPREAMRLEGDPAAPRLMTCRTRLDKTEQLLAYCSRMVRELRGAVLCGFIFKERSPSCGLGLVPLYGGVTSETFTIGLFADELRRCIPLMPLEEAERLNNPSIRASFIERVLLYRQEMEVTRNGSCSDPSPLKAKQ